MGLRAFAAKQWEQIRGNAKWAFLGILWTPMAAAIKFIFQQAPHVPGWVAWVTIGIVSAIAFVWVAKSQRRNQEQRPTAVQESVQVLATRPGLVPELPNFNFDTYFRTAHTSLLTEQTERDIGVLVARQHPNDREATLLKFIGMGFWGYMHETTWMVMFRSQFTALTELNAKGGLMPLAGIQSHFEKAKVDFPNLYSNYSFQQWMNYMTSHMLWIRHPSDMIEITVRGRDFLKFLTHWGWTADNKSG